MWTPLTLVRTPISGYGKDCRYRHEQTEAEGTAARRAESASGDGQDEELELLRRFYIKHSGPKMPKGRCDTCDANRVEYNKEKMTEVERRIEAQMRILAYLVGTTNHRLEVDRVKGTVWSSYSDSDQGGDRRFGSTTSRTGIMLCCNGMPYHWRSNKRHQQQ